MTEISYLPNRDELLRAFEEILRLAPPKSEHDEAVFEYVRRTERGEVLPEPEDPGEPTQDDLARFRETENS